VVTIKFKGTEEYGILERLKHAMPPLTDEFYLTRLCANKNEVCAFGITRSSSGTVKFSDPSNSAPTSGFG
jgi:hypothetical protein